MKSVTAKISLLSVVISVSVATLLTVAFAMTFTSMVNGQITLLDVTEALEGKLCISDCLSVPQECPLSAECPVRSRWGYLQLAILRELASTTLSQLVNEVNQKEAPCQGLFAPGDIVVESLPAHKGAA